MSVEPQSVSENLGSLRSCLVEGDPAQRKRERSIRRRALIISVFLQTAILAALVLMPLFGKPAPLVTPIPPIPIYRKVGEVTHRDRAPEPPRHPAPNVACRFCPPTHIPNQIVMVDREPEPFGRDAAGPTDLPPCPTCIDIPGGDNNRPVRPVEPRPTTPRIIHTTKIDPAMLIHRVEPVFPPLAQQTHRGGRVELRAVIATDGTIKSLQVVSGDPLFYQSAMNAVQEWRYRPTILNGQPVEIDTFITVIYNVE